MQFAVLRAWGVHLYTALGLVCALFAFIGLIDGNARMMWMWLGFALVIDSTDGMMARRFQVSKYVPRFDGRKLDDITDYINYVLVPVIALYKFDLVSAGFGWVLGIVLLCAAYGFNMDAAKTEDGYFTGFPNYWNVVVFYMYLFRTAEWLNVTLLLLFAVMIFWPVKYLYPSKTKFMKPLNMLVSALWILVCVGLVALFDAAPTWLLWLSLLGPVYYMGLSFLLHFFPAIDKSHVHA